MVIKRASEKKKRVFAATFLSVNMGNATEAQVVINTTILIKPAIFKLFHWFLTNDW